MALTGLDIALQRISMIENKFQSLMNAGAKTDTAFQNILDDTVKIKTGQGTPADKANITELIEKYSDANNLDADFVKAVIQQESGFNPNATSKCGAMGLMQLMPKTAESLGVTNAYDAEQNIYGGTKYLKGLLDRFDNNKELALAAYTAGPNAVKKYGGIPPYAETQNYVKRVLSNYDSMKGGY